VGGREGKFRGRGGKHGEPVRGKRPRANPQNEGGGEGGFHFGGAINLHRSGGSLCRKILNGRIVTAGRTKKRLIKHRGN